MTDNKPLTVPCPVCGKPVVWTRSNRFRPFCSERCRLIDLGQWGSNAYRIEGAPGSADSLDPSEALPDPAKR